MRAPNAQRSALSVHVLSVVVSDVVIVVVPAIAIVAATAVVVADIVLVVVDIVIAVVAAVKRKKLGKSVTAMWQPPNPESQSRYDEVHKPLEANVVVEQRHGSRQIAHTGAHGRDAKIYCLVHGITPCTTSVALLS